jgi:hypothetical protein
MSYMLDLEIAGLPKTFNVLARKQVIWIRKQERERWSEIVYCLTLSKRPERPLEQARIVLERHSSVAPDYDGLVSSFKYVIDGLVASKIISDDNMRVIGVPEFSWVKASPKDGKIRIKVFEVEREIL